MFHLQTGDEHDVCGVRFVNEPRTWKFILYDEAEKKRERIINFKLFEGSGFEAMIHKVRLKFSQHLIYHSIAQLST